MADSMSDKTAATKSKSAIKRDKNRRRARARARASAVASATDAVTPALPTFVGHDPDLMALDFTADVAVRYVRFKKEMSHHAGKVDGLLSSVIETGSDAGALKAIADRVGVKRPTLPRTLMESDADQLLEKERYEHELWKYRADCILEMELTDTFINECGKFFWVVVGQLSQQIMYLLKTLPNFAYDVRRPCNLAKLFVSLDQVILGGKKDPAQSLKVLSDAINTEQSPNMSFSDFCTAFESRLELLEPKFDDENCHLRHLLSPVLLCAPHFAQQEYGKSYEKCTRDEKEKVNLIASNEIKACLLSSNNHGSLPSTIY